MNSENNANFFSRLRRLRGFLGKTQAEMAELLGVSRNYVYILESKSKPPGRKILAKLNDLEKSTGLLSDPVTEYRTSPRNYGGPYWGQTNQAPVVSWAQAGTEWHDFSDLTNSIDEHYPTTCKDANCFYLRIQGDSMEPRYVAGDLVMLMPNNEARNGDLVVARQVDGPVLFKLLHWSADLLTARLTSYNDRYPELAIQKTSLRWVYPVHSVLRIVREA